MLKRYAHFYSISSSLQYFLLSFALLLVFWNCEPATIEEETQNPEDIALLFEHYHKGTLELNPIQATFAGEEGYNDLLPNNLTAEYRKEAKEFYENILEDLKAYDKAGLSETDQMSYDILKWECDMALEGLNYQKHLTPIDQMWTMQLMIGQFASGASAQPFETVEDYDNWLKRLNAYVSWADTAIANMKIGIEKDYVLPKPLIEKVIPQLQDFDHGSVEEHLFYSPIQQFPDSFSETDKERLTVAYSEMIEENIIPVYQRLSSFFEEEYLPAGRTSTGIDALAGGKDFYDYQIKYYTTTEMSADEIFELGKQEVARLRSEMEKVMEEVGYEGDLKSFFDYVRTKPELTPFDDPQEVIANFNAIHEKMKPNLEKLFDLVPKTEFEVRRTEAFREASASAEYNQGSLDGTRPGIFYVPIPDVKKYNIVSDEDLFLHEAIPGHHYQISLQQENTDLPEFRRVLWYSAYGEGWALYSESLGKELGLYNDPYQYFGMLSAEMHRAIRLVVDAGMHTKGWTREQAIQYSLENETVSETGIISEIERYMAEPGQALSYKIGQLKIMELRAGAEQELDEQFDLKVFHNKVLESGCVPLAILEAKIEKWVKELKGS